MTKQQIGNTSAFTPFWCNCCRVSVGRLSIQQIEDAHTREETNCCRVHSLNRQQLVPEDAEPGPLDRYRQAAERIAASYPVTCPWLGHREICPAFEADRETWWCPACRREFVVGA